MISLCYINMFHAVHPSPGSGMQGSQASWEASTPRMPTPKKLMTNLQQKAFSERFQDRLRTILLRLFPTAACGYVKNMLILQNILSHPLNFFSAPVSDRNATLKKTVESLRIFRIGSFVAGSQGESLSAATYAASETITYGPLLQ